MATLLSGSKIAARIKERHLRKVRSLGRPLQLAVLVIGDDPASQVYARVKERYGEDIGVKVEVLRVTDHFAEVKTLIERLNADPATNGLIVQLPLPGSLDEDMVINLIEPSKDVDGLNPGGSFDPATPLGIMWLLAAYKLDRPELKFVVVGQGRLVGRPLAAMLRRAGFDVTVCDDKTIDLAAKTLAADVIITATGRPGLIKGDMVKAGAAVIDAGTKLVGGRLVGDVAPALYQRDDTKITPNPGGVGPMTVAALFDNLIRTVKPT